MQQQTSGSDPIYTAERICGVLARRTFAGALCVVDRCTRLGSECDLLVVTTNLRAIDVEVKISRADLKADRKKDKWFDFPGFGRMVNGEREPPPVPRDWPRNVWKHYYAISAPIWRDDLLEHCQPKSGVITVELNRDGALRHIDVKRRCRANRSDTPLKPEVVVDIARLASLRMWDAYRERDARVGRAA